LSGAPVGVLSDAGDVMSFPAKDASMVEKADFVAVVSAQSRMHPDRELGVGVCPGRVQPTSGAASLPLGHIWRSHAEDANRTCRFCDQRGRRNPVEDRDGPRGFFELYTALRAEVFGPLGQPASAHGKPKAKS
jgi:hypothetical protein